MASSVDYVQFVAEQMGSAGEITYKKMFGEYGLYRNGKMFALVCDNTLYIKITEGGKSLLKNYQTAPPYNGAKPALLIEDVENAELLSALAVVTCMELPDPKPKKTKIGKKPLNEKTQNGGNTNA